MTHARPLQEALAGAELVHDRHTISRAIDTLAARIRNDYAGVRPLFLTVMNGGMFFGAELALALGIDIEFDYLHATRYRGTTAGTDLTWLRRPGVPVAGKRVLLVDDILDEGPTLVAVRDWCRAEGAADVRMAVLTWKRHGRGVPDLVPEYWGLEVPDRYVFGYGMDYYGQGRNLPAIYAL
ncbi:MAG TPA: hypoxanthine-guanine phosphoribosyltransferase [Xanthomonadaceae bacterium]|nr:hypoxanthine-guanine phosphoribosyltransferase [Xanthomonadaceae bacterium]